MSFDWLAPHYRWLELVLAGGKLQRCRTAFLSSIDSAQNVLILGEGNGRFLLECRRALHQGRITCVDASARMLGLAQKRVSKLKGAKPVEFVHADVLAWVPPKRAFDLIVTHFFLDCFRPEQLERLLATLAAAATPNAVWLVSDFQIPGSGLRRWRAQWIHWVMYAFFRVVTRLPAGRWTSPDSFLRSHGFVLRQRLETEWGLLRADRWDRRQPIAGDYRAREAKELPRVLAH